MANVKELRGRIKSVGSIAKITRAMEMVASMKLRKVQARALAFHPYTLELQGIMNHLAESVGEDAQLPLFQHRDVKTTGIFVVSSDRGLCGAYNANIFGKVAEAIEEIRATDPDRKIKLFVYGKKAFSYYQRRGFDIERFFAEPALDALDYNAAILVGRTLVEAFETGLVDEVRIAFTAFESAARFVPQVEPFLPVPKVPDTEQVRRADYLLEPDAETVFNLTVPKYLQTVVFDAMLSSLTSEYASRRMAMKGATDAATDMEKSLKKVYNRARQESITKELLDIVGGASAVA